MRTLRHLFVGAIAASLAGAALAQGRPLAIAAGKPFKHKPSGFAVAAAAGGLNRAGVVAYDPDQLDVRIGFGDPASGEATDIYLYRRVLGDGAIWFDRAARAVALNPRLGTVTQVAAPAAFTPAGAAANSGLVAAFSATGEFTASAVAVTSTDEWLIKVRSSSRTLTPDQVARRAMDSLAALKWPGRVTASVLAPVERCPSPLPELAVARPAGDQAQTALMGGLLANTRGKWAPGLRYCLEKSEPSASVYREVGSSDRYLLAIGDNGEGVVAGPNVLGAFLAQGKGAPTFTVTLYQLERTSGFGTFASLPSPQQVGQMLRGGRTTYSVPTWGKNRNQITVDPALYTPKK